MLRYMNFIAAIMAFCITAGHSQMDAGFGLAGMMGGGVGLSMMSDLSPAEYMLLDNAVKQIVGPTASPDPTLIMLARQQGGPPRSITQSLPFITAMQALARRMNVKPPGVNGVPTAEQINTHIMQKATQYMQQRMVLGTMGVNPLMSGMMGATAGAATGAAGSTSGTGTNNLINMMALGGMF